MSMVKFCTLCDKCEKRSPEYSAWPSCRICMDHVCTSCASPDTESEDELHAVTCKDCEIEYWRNVAINLLTDSQLDAKLPDEYTPREFLATMKNGGRPYCSACSEHPSIPTSAKGYCKFCQQTEDEAK